MFCLAVSTLHATILFELHREIQHPNILSILGVETEKDKVSIITNFVQGSNLHMLIFDVSHPRV